MISCRADFFNTFKRRDTEVTVVGWVGQAMSNPTEGFFVLFKRPECEDKDIKELVDARLRGILEAKSFVKNSNNFILTGFPSMTAAESYFWDVFKYLKTNNAVISAGFDPFTWVPRTRTKEFVIRMKVRG